MAFTALMFVALFVSYALMFGLVKFTENVIAKRRSAAADDDGLARTGDTRNAP